MIEPTIASRATAQEEWDDNPPGRSWLWPLGGLVALLSALLAFWTLTQSFSPDAWVQFRTAQNIARGQGFAFNPGEPALTTTAPLQVLLIAGGGAIFGAEHVPSFACILGFALSLLSAAAVYGVLRSALVTPPWAVATIVVMGLHPALLVATTSGAETPLALALMASSLLAVVRARWIAAGVLAALMVLAHASGWLWAALILLAIAWGAGRQALWPVMVFAMVVATWAAWAWVYFGSPIPLPIVAARVQSAQSADAGVLAVARWYGPWLLDHLWLPHSYGRAAIRCQVWLWLALLGLGLLGIARRPRRLHGLITLPAMVAAFGLVFLLGFDARGAGSAAPLVWCSVLVGMLGLWELWVISRLYWREFDLPHWVLVAAAAAVALALTLSVTNRGAVAYAQCRDAAVRQRYAAAVGGWLAAHARPTDRVAVDGVSVAAYTHRPIIDLSGAISPEVVSIARGCGSFAETLQTVLATMAPELVVLSADAVGENRSGGGALLFDTREQAWHFRAHYTPAEEFGHAAGQAGAEGNSPHLSVYRRRPDTPPPAALNVECPR